MERGKHLLSSREMQDEELYNSYVGSHGSGLKNLEAAWQIPSDAAGGEYKVVVRQEA
jgi:hypothetical protein